MVGKDPNSQLSLNSVDTFTEQVSRYLADVFTCPDLAHHPELNSVLGHGSKHVKSEEVKENGDTTVKSKKYSPDSVYNALKRLEEKFPPKNKSRWKMEDGKWKMSSSLKNKEHSRGKKKDDDIQESCRVKERPVADSDMSEHNDNDLIHTAERPENIQRDELKVEYEDTEPSGPVENEVDYDDYDYDDSVETVLEQNSNEIVSKADDENCEPLKIRISKGSIQKQIQAAKKKNKFTNRLPDWLPCNLCKYKTRYKSNLQNHIRAIHEGITYNCHLCEYKSKEKRCLKQHIKSQHDGEMQQCPDCEYRCVKVSTMKDHIQTNHKGVPHQCPHCALKYSTLGNLNRHIATAHNNDSCFKCNLCDYQGNRKDALNSHIRIVHEGVKYPCPHCTFQGRYKSTLDTHLRVAHSMTLQHECPHCDYSSDNPNTLRMHIQRKHEADEESFLCPHCGHQASDSNNLKQHIQVVHEGYVRPKKHMCHICDYKCAFKQVLKFHIEAEHEGIRHICPHCGLSVRKLKTLQEHIKLVHEGFKLQCPHCDYKVGRKDNMKKHIEIVHEGKRHPCPHCNYQATRSQNLKVHIETVHEGLKFQCPHCDFQVTRKDYLQKHISATHPDVS